MSDDVDRIAGVTLTHPDKVLFAEQGITKRQLAEYWLAVSELALRYLRDRPLTLVRCPSGQQANCFYQKHLRDSVADAVPRIRVDHGGDPYVMVDGLPALVALVQLGVLEFHVWGARAPKLDQPDMLVFDLDPGEGVAYPQLVEAAQQLRSRVDDAGLTPFVRLTGGKGLHVVTPIKRGPSWDDVKRFAQGMADDLAETDPDRYTSTMSKAKRKGRVFVDYLRNQREATAIVSYGVRARAGAPVALPLAWDDLDASHDAVPKFGLQEVPDIIEARKDPWANFDSARGKLP